VDRPWLRLLAACSCASIVILLSAGAVSAHVVEHAGLYTLEIGWQHEPTYVGDPNGVQVIVTRAEKGVTDLTSDDIKVVVSTGSQQSSELTFDPGFDLEEMEGQFGEYDAAIVPTAPGDYTFHVTGSIHGTPVDVTVKSGDTTFNTVQGTSDLQFPTKLPTLPEIATRLDRIDSRLASPTPAAATGPTQASVDAAAAQATDARQTADRALFVGGGLGIAGLIAGVIGVLLALRARAARPRT
jgi:hypothetical protein